MTHSTGWLSLGPAWLNSPAQLLHGLVVGGDAIGPELAAGCICLQRMPSVHTLLALGHHHSEMSKLFKLSRPLWFGVWMGKGITLEIL